MENEEIVANSELTMSKSDFEENKLNNQIEETEPVKLRYILAFSVVTGLFLNFIQTYIRITMGLLSIGVGSLFSVLLIAKLYLKRKNADTTRNFSIIAIAFGATQAAEASVGFLFLIWLSINSDVFNISFNPPSWLLPSSQVILSRNIFSPEWVIPILVHLFLMLIPGIIGLVIGWVIKERFINNDKDYPFPSVIQTTTTIDVLSSNSSGKGKLLKKWGIIGFLIASVTVPFFALDISNANSGYILGLTLGPIGLALFSAGFLINRKSISFTIGISSVLAYTILSPIFIGPRNLSYFDFFNFGLENVYLSFGIGLLLGGVILGPIIISPIKSMLSKRSKNQEADYNNKEKQIKLQNEENEEFKGNKYVSLILQHKWSLFLILITYAISISFVLNLNILNSSQNMLIIVMLFWIVIIGGFVNGFLMISGSAKSGAVVTPPFIFDELPIFLSGASGYLPYVAMPRSESDGSLGIVRSLKLAGETKLNEKLGLYSYLIGYFASSLTTPFFALLLYFSFGIGTEQFPAPAFPVQGAIISAFASRSIETFLSISQLAFGLIAGILIAFFGSNVSLGLALGLFFPPHMALCLTFGGLTRVLYTRKVGPEKSNKDGPTIATGLAFGSSLVIPILIILALI